MQVGCCCVRRLSRSSCEVAGRVQGRGRRGEVMNALFKKLGIQCTPVGRMWGWNNKVLDLKTPSSSHENFCL